MNNLAISPSFNISESQVHQNNLLRQNAKVRVYQARVLSTLLYGSETCTYMPEERRLSTFHLRRILDIKWQDHIPNSDILTRAGVPYMYSLLSQRQQSLRWLDHVRRMDDGRISKVVLHGQVASGRQRVGRPALRFKDTCKYDMKTCKIDTDTWRQKVKQGIEHALPAAGTADRGLTFTATQDAAAQQHPGSEPLSGAPGIIFRDYALPTITSFQHLSR